MVVKVEKRKQIKGCYWLGDYRIIDGYAYDVFARCVGTEEEIIKRVKEERERVEKAKAALNSA